MAALEAENYLAELEDAADVEPKAQKSPINNAAPEYRENPMIPKV
jgi:hypothetical protein